MSSLVWFFPYLIDGISMCLGIVPAMLYDDVNDKLLQLTHCDLVML